MITPAGVAGLRTRSTWDLGAPHRSARSVRVRAGTGTGGAGHPRLGVMIGVRWACDQHARVRALVDSDGGFFSDRHWHDLANTMRIAGDGERVMAADTRGGPIPALPCP